jgi:hypothetical protein
MFIYFYSYLDLAPLPSTPIRLSHRFSQRVNEIRSFVTQQFDLAMLQALDPVVAFTASALAVLTSQQEVLHHGSTKEEQDQIAEYYSVAGVVFWLIIIAVDVGCDNAIEISPADDKPEGDTSFVNT